MLRYLMTMAKQNGISGFMAEVLAQNRGMRAVFKNSDCTVHSRLSDGVYRYVFDF